MNVELQLRVFDGALCGGARCRAVRGTRVLTEDARYKIISAENFERGLPLGVIDCDSRAMFRTG